MNARLDDLRLTGASMLLCALVLTAVNLHADDGDRLIDKSIEPPTIHSPDWTETAPAPVSLPPPQAFGPVAPAARQPTGALSGRIVFTNGGHGWTWDPNYWRTQRGTLNEMNEDYGNLEQMNFFAAYCFNAGAVVVPMRPLGQQTNEVVMDNDDAAVTYTGSWAESTSTLFFGDAGDVPYRYASLDDVESATATYTPNIPAAGFYPVYTWVRHGSDRGDQLYRIRHTGGESQVRIPHHMVGNGWVWLGEYYFNAGSNAAAGSVVISNLRGSATGGVIIADAIRFGNGMGTVDRGTGVSDYPREEENCRYWFQANIAQGQSSTLYNGGGDDESDSWSAPPKMSAEMNREEAGNMYKRIHISFHSNAGGGRGTLALITGTPTTNQTALAQIAGNEVNDDLVALGSPPLEVAWQDRSTVTYSGGYSEIDGSLFNYEMDATIIEVAFHDSASDAMLMRDPRARSAVGKAAMHAVIKYMNQFDGLPLNFLPEPPVNLRAIGDSTGAITLSWVAPVSTGGSGSPTGYVVYRSSNGYGFGNPVVLGNVTTTTITGLTAGTDYYFRVAATNAGGESLPGEVVGCRTALAPGDTRVLVVNAFDRYDRTTNLRMDIGRQNYSPPAATGAIERVLPRRTNSFDYVLQHGKAISAAGYAFDSCQNEAVASGTVSLTNYPIVFWACGQESTGDETFSSAEQSRITTFRNAGGHLFVSGSEIAWDLDRATGPTAADRNFFNTHLHADFGSDANDNSGNYNLASTATGIFAARTPTTFDDGSRGVYWVQTPDVLTPVGTGTSVALTYGAGGTNSAIQYDGSAGGGKVVYFGFPFETISSVNRRSQYTADILSFFTRDVLVRPGSTWKYHDTGADLGTAWAQPEFNDTSWSGGPAQLGFGESDENTPVAANSSRITTYFRHTFTVVDARRFGTLALRLLRDDGAVVWLNGAQVLRSNLPQTGDILWGTPADSGISGTDENVFINYTLDARDLRTGVNVIAVELHQFGTGSSDLSFDLELAGVPVAPVALIASGATWTFRDNGVAPPASWTTSAYDDSAWFNGPARLGYGGDGELTTVGWGTDSANRYRSTWFRHTFNVANASAFDALRVDIQRDDGAIVWLNGVELFRDNLPSGAINASNFATTGISAPEETAWRSFTVPASALVTGNNVFAVEVHQATPGSSDIGLDLRLFGLPQTSLGYGAWKAQKFGSDATNALISSELANTDGDSASNIVEYALAGNPNTSDSTLTEADATSGRLALRFMRNALATDLTLTVQAAESPAGPWIDLARSVAGNPIEPVLTGVTVIESVTGAVRAVEVRDIFALSDPSHPRRFMRLYIQH